MGLSFALIGKINGIVSEKTFDVGIYRARKSGENRLVSLHRYFVQKST
jgi:hypothetical protein